MKFFSYSLILLLLATSQTHAQEQPDRLEVAEKYFFKHEYAYAAPLYEKLAAVRKPRATVLYKLAYCYEEMKQYDKALAAYQTYVNKFPDNKTESLLRIADILKTLERYPEALAAYRRYWGYKPDDSKLITARMNGCDSAIKWLQQPTNAVVRNAAGLNTAFSDWGAVYYGNELVFTSENRLPPPVKKSRDEKKRGKAYGWTGNPFLSLFTTHDGYVTTAINDSATARTGFSEVINNYEYHVGPAVFSKQLDTVYFTVTNDGNDVEKFRYKKRWRYEKSNLELYFSVRKDSAHWQKPVPFSYNQARNYSVGHAALSKDGTILYFVSDMPGGYGKTDIWFCRINADGSWQAPQNCGAAINTEEEEVFPTIGANGSLYFSSTGHPGMGGLDIFVANGSGAEWTKPVNLRQPYNSGYDDFYFTLAADGSGYLSSNRPNGKGSDDIYAFTIAHPRDPVVVLQPKEVIIKTVVLNAVDSSVIAGGMVTFAGAGLPKNEFTSDRAGVVQFNSKPFEGAYKVSAASKGFTADSLVLAMNPNDRRDTITSYLYLKPIQVVATVKPAETIPYKVGDRFVLEDLYYDYNKHNIRADAAVVLDKLVVILNKYPALAIELSSHTDSRGSDTYNMALSQRRAESAVSYLISKGIATKRLVAKGYGESMLLNKCSNGVSCTEPEHQLNRRTEVRVLKVE